MKTSYHPFLCPSPLPGNIDLFLHRTSILNELKSVARFLRGTLLDVGCGESPYKQLLLGQQFGLTSYLGLDRPGRDSNSDLTWDGKIIPLSDNSVDSVICTEVLEHCPEPAMVLREIHRVLKPNGYLFLTVPFLWPLHEVPYDWQRLTPFALSDLLNEAGFRDCTIRPLGGWDASLAQCMGLYLRRRPMNYVIRTLLTLLLFPVYHLLLVLDRRELVQFKEGQMVSGLAAGAWASANS